MATWSSVWLLVLAAGVAVSSFGWYRCMAGHRESTRGSGVAEQPDERLEAYAAYGQHGTILAPGMWISGGGFKWVHRRVGEDASKAIKLWQSQPWRHVLVCSKQTMHMDNRLIKAGSSTRADHVLRKDCCQAASPAIPLPCARPAPLHMSSQLPQRQQPRQDRNCHNIRSPNSPLLLH